MLNQLYVAVAKIERFTYAYSSASLCGHWHFTGFFCGGCVQSSGILPAFIKLGSTLENLFIGRRGTRGPKDFGRHTDPDGAKPRGVPALRLLQRDCPLSLPGPLSGQLRAPNSIWTPCKAAPTFRSPQPPQTALMKASVCRKVSHLLHGDHEAVRSNGDLFAGSQIYKSFKKPSLHKTVQNRHLDKPRIQSLRSAM